MESLSIASWPGPKVLAAAGDGASLGAIEEDRSGHFDSGLERRGIVRRRLPFGVGKRDLLEANVVRRCAGPSNHPHHPRRPYYWANQTDTWQGTTHRDNTLRRWVADLQNDFRARMDWCVKSPREANHPPTAVLNGRYGKTTLHLTAAPGATVELSAAGSHDPDSQTLTYVWLVYPEAGTYRGALTLADAATPRARIKIPAEATGKTIHVILAVRDEGKPILASYRLDLPGDVDWVKATARFIKASDPYRHLVTVHSVISASAHGASPRDPIAPLGVSASSTA